MLYCATNTSCNFKSNHYLQLRPFQTHLQHIPKLTYSTYHISSIRPTSRLTQSSAGSTLHLLSQSIIIHTMTAPGTSFLDLPRELRDLIYRNCFSDHIISHKRPTAAVREDSLTISWTHTRPAVRNAPDKNLLCLNHQIRSETREIARSITAVQLEFSIEQSFQRYPAFARIDDYFSTNVTDKFVNIQRLELLIDMSRLSAPLGMSRSSAPYSALMKLKWLSAAFTRSSPPFRTCNTLQ